MRGVKRGQETRLPKRAGATLFPAKPIALVTGAEESGDVNLARAVGAGDRRGLGPGRRQIVEIGTFDGRTTLNFASNSAPHLAVFTLDLAA